MKRPKEHKNVGRTPKLINIAHHTPPLHITSPTNAERSGIHLSCTERCRLGGKIPCRLPVNETLLYARAAKVICVSPDEVLPKGETYMLLEVFHKSFPVSHILQ